MKRLFLVMIAVILLVGTVSADQMIFRTLTTNDGHANRYVSSGAAFTTIRSGAGTAVSTTIPMHVRLTARNSGSTFTNLSRAGIQFDTSVLPDNAVISSAVVSVYGTSKANTFATAPSFALVSFTPATNGTMVAADYNKGGTTTLSNAIAYASISTTAYNNFTVSDLSTISTTSWTRYMIKSSWDYTGTGPTWGASYNMLVAFNSNESSAYKPLLTVTYTVPVQDTTPPASITGLNNDTTGVTTINWSWQNPIDQDFNGTMVYQNDTFLKNVSKETTYVNWSELIEGTQYTISTRTFDLTGNVNQTWVNKTETTLFSGDTPQQIVILQEPHPITDALGQKSGTKSVNQILSEETVKALSKGTYPYNISILESQIEVKIVKFRCDEVSEICGYWVDVTRNGQEVYTDSPIWISPPPYQILVSEEFNPRTNELIITLREDPKLAVEQILQRYVDTQPLGKAVVGTKE